MLIAPKNPSQATDRAKYLFQFDDRHPKELLCYTCESFHVRTPPKTSRLRSLGTAKQKKFKELICSCEKANKSLTQTFATNYIYYKWPALQEAMRGFPLGTGYGSPYLFNRIHPRKGREYDVLALAVDGRLLIRNRITVPFPYYRRNHFDKDIHQSRDDLQCPHMRETLTAHNFQREVKAAVRFTLESEKDGSTEHLQGFVFYTHRCTSCPTEVSLEVMPSLLYSGHTSYRMRMCPYVISAKYYTDFGKCESPDEMEWRALTTWYKQPQDKWEDLPPCARVERENVPREEWPCIDITHIEPISTRFERQLAMRPTVVALRKTESKEPPNYNTLEGGGAMVQLE
jgi:hypothetical protein